MHRARQAATWRILALGVVSLAAVGGAPPRSVAAPAQAPEESGQLATEPPPPDPEGDIDPVRPRGPDEIAPQAAPVRPIRFPLRSYTSYVDTFGACRDGCSRYHEGIDIFAPKLTPLIAAVDGHVTWLRTDASGTAGNGVGVTDAEGWRYLYLHANNDTPGTDDGANPAAWRFIPGLTLGTKVYAGQHIGYSGDSGNAEGTPPHLHFEMRTPDGVDVNPYPSLLAASRAPPVPRLFRFDSLRGGTADDHLAWATYGTTAIMACDTNGDGFDEPVFRDGPVFWLSPSGSDTRVNRSLQYGTASDLGICGDWNGDGRDTPGVRRGNLWLLRNSWTPGAAQVAFAYGWGSDAPVTGDWNGDGIDTVGVVRGNHWLLTDHHGPGAAGVAFAYGRAGDRPVPGDWNGDSIDTAGVRRGTTMYLRATTGGGSATQVFAVGAIGDGTVVARWWTGTSGRDTVSVWRRRPR